MQPASTNNCANCGSSDSKSKCSRCSIPYCTRDCQLKHWSVHKQVCKTAEQKIAELQNTINEIFSRVNHLIAGNVIILNAWYRKERGMVEIEVTENLADFASRGTHFLHMVYKDLGSSDSIDKYSELDKCYVKFKLTNYEYESFIPIRLAAPEIRAKQAQPSQEWTLMFDF